MLVNVETNDCAYICHKVNWPKSLFCKFFSIISNTRCIKLHSVNDYVSACMYYNYKLQQCLLLLGHQITHCNYAIDKKHDFEIQIYRIKNSTSCQHAHKRAEWRVEESKEWDGSNNTGYFLWDLYNNGMKHAGSRFRTLNILAQSTASYRLCSNVLIGVGADCWWKHLIHWNL